MNVKFNAMERNALLTYLPQSANVVTGRAIMKTTEAMVLTEAELEKCKAGELYKLGQVPEREFVLDDMIAKLVADKLKQADTAGQLPVGHISLYDKLVPQG